MKVWAIVSVNWNKGTPSDTIPKLKFQYSENWYLPKESIPEETLPLINCFPHVYSRESEAKWIANSYHYSYEKDKICLYVFPLEIKLFSGRAWTDEVYFYIKYKTTENGPDSITCSEEAYPEINEPKRHVHFFGTNDVMAGRSKVYEVSTDTMLCTHFYKSREDQVKYKILHVTIPNTENIGWR